MVLKQIDMFKYSNFNIIVITFITLLTYQS